MLRAVVCLLAVLTLAIPARADDSRVERTPAAQPGRLAPKSQQRRRVAKAPVSKKATPKAPAAKVSFPTFELHEDGSTTLALRVSRSPELEESQRRGHYVLRLKNARLIVHNDAHVLHAEHFESLVWQARLRPSGADVLFDVTLRADAPPERRVRAVTREERAEEPHRDAAASEVVVLLTFPPPPSRSLR